MTDASLQKIAATYGTPTFVFDTDALQARVRAIQAIWGREIDLCYSIKANPFLLPAMMQVTARLEVCSPGELSLCESLHAADARVIYSGVNKTPVDIARALADGVGTCTAESLLQVRYLQDAARKAAKRLPVLLRLNAGSQFGMSKEDLFTALAHRRETPDLEFIGIHYFVGTQRKKLVNQQKSWPCCGNCTLKLSRPSACVCRNWNTAQGWRCRILTATILPTHCPRPKTLRQHCAKSAAGSI